MLSLRAKVLCAAMVALIAIGNFIVVPQAVRAASYYRGHYFAPWHAWVYRYSAANNPHCGGMLREIARHPLWRVPAGGGRYQRPGLYAHLPNNTRTPRCQVIGRSRIRYAIDDAAWQIADYQVEYYSFLMLYSVREEGLVRYNGSQVWAMGGPECRVRWGVGVSVTQRRCDIWNDGGAWVQFCEPSADWWVSAIADGLPFGQTIFARVRLFTDGHKGGTNAGWF